MDTNTDLLEQQVDPASREIGAKTHFLYQLHYEEHPCSIGCDEPAYRSLSFYSDDPCIPLGRQGVVHQVFYCEGHELAAFNRMLQI